MIRVTDENYDLPMKIVEKISERYNEKIVVGVDKDYMIYVYIPNITRVKNKEYLSDITGRGWTYHEACVSFINKLVNKNYNIRYLNELYATEEIRNIIIKTNNDKSYVFEEEE